MPTQAPEAEDNALCRVIDVERLYTKKEAAEKLRVSTRAIRHWMADGRLKFCRAGNRPRIPGAYIIAMLQASSPENQNSTSA